MIRVAKIYKIHQYALKFSDTLIRVRRVFCQLSYIHSYLGH